ncbi:MAG: hypothetical protein HRT47_12155 [Candidatus Caenarcaniphilales bacterium]|nr:hypothetical protein [Candidatus Caenarcaniphilales bacterium]
MFATFNTRSSSENSPEEQALIKNGGGLVADLRQPDCFEVIEWVRIEKVLGLVK